VFFLRYHTPIGLILLFRSRTQLAFTLRFESSTVTYNGVAHTASFVSSTQLNITLSASDQTTAGAFPVVVTNPAPGGRTSNTANFTITSGTNPVPTINSLNPNCAPVGGQAFTLLVNGLNFVASSVVWWNGSDRG